jgi:hypothetical protein
MTNEDLDLVIGWLVEHADDAEHVSVVPIAVGGAVSMPSIAKLTAAMRLKFGTDASVRQASDPNVGQWVGRWIEVVDRAIFGQLWSVNPKLLHITDGHGSPIAFVDRIDGGTIRLLRDPWIDATNPIVETWIGKLVEISTEAGATASGELLGVDATDLHMDLRPKYPEPQEIIRSNWRVRLAEG